MKTQLLFLFLFVYVFSTIPNCKNFNASSNTCLKCDPSYYLVEFKECEACHPTCK